MGQTPDTDEPVPCPACDGDGNGRGNRGAWVEVPAPTVTDDLAGTMEGMQARFVCLDCRGTGTTSPGKAAEHLLTEDEPERSG